MSCDGLTVELMDEVELVGFSACRHAVMDWGSSLIVYHSSFMIWLERLDFGGYRSSAFSTTVPLQMSTVPYHYSRLQTTLIIQRGYC